MSCVWKYSRAKGSNRLALLYLAENAQMDGRDAYPGVRAISHATQLSDRGTRYVLHRLEEDREILIHHNKKERRTWRTSRGHVFCPVWFIDVRCACDLDAYLAEGATAPVVSTGFPEGRREVRQSLPDVGPAIFAGAGPAIFAGGVRQTLRNNRNGASDQPEESRTRSTRKDPLLDPLRNEEERACAAPVLIQGPPAAMNARSNHPVFKGQQLLVFDWMLEDLQMVLGAHADAFDLHAWFYELDAKVMAAGVVLPQRDKGAWLQAETVKEAMRRGLPVVVPEPVRNERQVRLDAVLEDAKGRR